jgi:hypothetical protein
VDKTSSFQPDHKTEQCSGKQWNGFEYVPCWGWANENTGMCHMRYVAERLRRAEAFPDLLEALKAITPRFEAALLSAPDYIVREGVAIIQRAQSAIAKAEGAK